MLGVAEAALDRDFAKRQVRSAQKKPRLGEPPTADFLAWRTSKLLHEAPVEPDGRDAKFGGELIDTPFARKVVLHKPEGLLDEGVVRHDAVRAGAHCHARRRHENRFSRRGGAIHEACEQRGAFAADSPGVVQDARKRNALVFAEQLVVAHAEDGKFFRHGYAV